ncbi:hypothetical protein P8C59_008504 [Phyllachora maydis]|uniref:Protein ORM1 n=1 Tax=Phyllachora maydis TaxID=1825666 RepID=A0AAD9IBW3_9PEZI|nr:hypothetical protein P8C59_008504 [Phyllachora maydis]
MRAGYRTLRYAAGLRDWLELLDTEPSLGSSIAIAIAIAIRHSPFAIDGFLHSLPANSAYGKKSLLAAVYHEPPEPLEQLSDQSALPNLNANWVNGKGAWTIHLVLIALLKIIYDTIPGVSQETSWTLTNITYMFGSYIMFHYVRGTPFEFNSGAYDNLNMWEQIDDGAQYTPAKKFLLSVPIVLFLLSTHYTHYDLAYFTINFLAVLGVVIPKLPYSHRMRVGLFSGIPEE